MTQPGQGWARRVTSSTLSQFRSLLRTGSERAAEAQSGEEDESSDVPTAGPTTSGESTSDRDAVGPEDLFRGTAIMVPPQHRAQRNNPAVAQSAATVLAGTTAPQPPASVTAPAVTADPTIDRRWFKQMSAADAQRPRSTNTNPTGHLTLVRSRHPIAQGSWFRENLFAGADWNIVDPPDGTRERATITFHMRIGQEDLGAIPLDVTFTPSFESGQGNRTTVVHWGETIGNRFRQNNYTDYYVTIERTLAGEFRMIINRIPVGEFIG